MSNLPPHVHVACAIIHENGLILATQRSEKMLLPLKWEFPGGKLEAGESAQDCLIRELQEELGITVRVYEKLETVTHCYTYATVTLHPFLCDQPEGQLTLYEHCAACWLLPQDLSCLDWAEADKPIISYLERAYYELHS
jgi:8-oxo-dGTP diphosphatase